MTADIYQQNLAVLRSTRPALAAGVESARPDPNRYRLIETSSGVHSLELIDDSGKAALWHSRHDPLREVQRELSAIDRSRVYMPILGGLGLGYALKMLWNNFRSDFFDAVFVEPDVNIFHLALHATNLENVLADPRLHIQIGTNVNEWGELVRKLMPSIMSCTPQYLPHAPSQILHSTFFQSALDILNQRIQLTRAEFDLLTRNGPLIQENMWRNLQSVASSIRLNDFRGSLQGRPAVVVAAGPSLDKNVSQLCGREDSVAIIAVDTAYRTLVKNGIHPHIVVTTDPTELNAKHFEGFSPAAHTILAFDPEVYSAIPNQWPHRKLFLNLEKTTLTRWIETEFGPYGYLPKGGSVGHTAFYLAREMGAEPIVFVGLDLAFDPKGGKTHAAESALHRSYESIPHGINSANLGPRFGAGPMRETIVWVPGVCGESVPTSGIMALYINQFAEEFALTQTKLIDATEGGAKLSGTETATLREVISTFSHQNGAIDLFSTFQPNALSKVQVNQAISRFISALANAAPIADKGRAAAIRLLARINESSNLRTTPQWNEMENAFSTLYQSEEIKIALEQALFAAVYSFIQKERQDQVELRLKKYANYFHSILEILPHFSELLKSL